MSFDFWLFWPKKKTVFAEHISANEWLQNAIEQRLRWQRRQALYAYGEAQARKLGYKEEDVDRLIHEFRDEERAGKHPENSHE